MRLWRVSASRELRPAGARSRGGRWDRPGTDVIYASSSLALATLEVFIRLDRRRAPAEMTAFSIDVPDDAPGERVETSTLPNNWDTYPAPPALQDIGTAWARRGGTLLLMVPSAILRVRRDLVPGEINYLIAPAHPYFRRVRATAHRYPLDPRMRTAVA